MKFLALPLLLLTIALAAELPSLTPPEENSILKAQHEVDQFNGQLKDMQAQFAQLQNQARELQTRFPEVQQQLTDAQKKLDGVIDATYKAHGLDKNKADFDAATLKFKEKEKK